MTQIEYCTTSNVYSTVAFDAFNFLLATIKRNSFGWFPLSMGCGASCRILRKSTFGVVFDKAPLSRKLSLFNSLKSVGKFSILLSLSLVNLLIVGETLSLRLLIPGAVKNLGCQGLQHAFRDFVVCEETQVVAMYQVIVGLLSTK